MGVEVEEARKKGRCIRNKKNGWRGKNLFMQRKETYVTTQRKQRTNKRITRREIHQAINHE